MISSFFTDNPPEQITSGLDLNGKVDSTVSPPVAIPENRRSESRFDRESYVKIPNMETSFQYLDFPDIKDWGVYKSGYNPASVRS